VITAEDRHKARTDAWLLPAKVKFGPELCRPLSLGSMLLFPRLGIDFAKAADPDWAEEVVLRYLWAHATDLDSVLWSTSAGTWEDELADYSFTIDVEFLVAPVLAYVEKVFRLMDALTVKIQPRPQTAGSGADVPPPDLLAPDFVAALVSDAGACLPGMTERALMWEMPVPRVLSYYHVQRWKSSEWTVPWLATRGSDEQLAAAKTALEAARAMAPPQTGTDAALALLDRLSS
jgi:hypothetical protein